MLLLFLGKSSNDGKNGSIVDSGGALVEKDAEEGGGERLGAMMVREALFGLSIYCYA